MIGTHHRPHFEPLIFFTANTDILISMLKIMQNIFVLQNTLKYQLQHTNIYIYRERERERVKDDIYCL